MHWYYWSPVFGFVCVCFGVVIGALLAAAGEAAPPQTPGPPRNPR